MGATGAIQNQTSKGAIFAGAGESDDRIRSRESQTASLARAKSELMKPPALYLAQLTRAGESQWCELES